MGLTRYNSAGVRRVAKDVAARGNWFGLAHCRAAGVGGQEEETATKTKRLGLAS
jgi:hypothetical protein